MAPLGLEDGLPIDTQDKCSPRAVPGTGDGTSITLQPSLSDKVDRITKRDFLHPGDIANS